MIITATTTAPDEVRRLFEEYAGILDMYASDQLAIMSRSLVIKRDCKLRAAVYAEIATEMRSIKFEEPK